MTEWVVKKRQDLRNVGLNKLNCICLQPFILNPWIDSDLSKENSLGCLFFAAKEKTPVGNLILSFENIWSLPNTF